MTPLRPHPVFFDPNRKRWPKIKFGIFALGLGVTAIMGILLASILITPALKSLSLPRREPPPKAAAASKLHQYAEGEAGQKPSPPRERPGAAAQFAQAPDAGEDAYKPLTIGYFVNWEDTSFSSLKLNARNLDVLIPEWLHLTGADGTVTENNPERRKMVTDWLAANRPGLVITPLINNYLEDWRGDILEQALAREASRRKMLGGILDFLSTYGFAGLSLDFESIPPSAQGNFLVFLREAAGALHAAGKTLSVNVPANDADFNYKAIAALADQVIVMAYDEHWSTGKPGPIAGMPWFTSVLRRRQADIPPAKLVIALANYAYDWTTAGPAESKSFEEAVLTAQESEGDIALDPASLNPSFGYEDEQDREHTVWMLDAATMFNQMAAAQPLHPLGFAIWRLGGEDPSIWSFFGRRTALDREAAEALRRIQFEYDIAYESQGEILNITKTPQTGERSIDFSAKTGLITQEAYLKFPSPYVITRYGASPGKIALTFDDGPDPRYTPAILDELKAAHAKATFFVIGSQAEKYPDLLRRIYAEGHDIGNHTYTHPNIAEISLTQLRLEVAATERLLETLIDRQSHLFRSPYGEDSEPETQDQVRPVEELAKLGYITVGMGIDPSDWTRPGTRAIIDATLEQAKAGQGNVVLLHDSGGDRSQTVAALPGLIGELRANGYELVTVSQLMGKDQSETMPPLTGENILVRLASKLGFFILSSWSSFIRGLFTVGIVLGLTRLAVVSVLALAERAGRRDRSQDEPFAGSVAVVIPAYNEAKVIRQTIASLLAADKPERFEIIVVDDGSTDDTLAVLRRCQEDTPALRVFSKPNAGKSEALNYGINRTAADVVVTLDADTIFAKDTITRLVARFADPKVGAVAGNAKVGNRINFLTRCQALEYITSQNLDRRAMNTINSITVVPGAVGAWRRAALNEAGGFLSDTMAEDADLTIRIRALGCKIVYEDRAVALTEAPDTLRGFIRQRFRWMYGTFQCAYKHRRAMGNPAHGFLGLFGLPSIWIFQILFPLISPALDLMIAQSLLWDYVNHLYHPAAAALDSFHEAIFYYALFLAADFATATLAFVLEPGEDFSLLIWTFLQRFFYRQLMYLVAIKAVVASLRGGETSWGKIERKATVKA
jgi:cellulose synthase/poly-beta-1,6-N-acetylglucosamine synthase-like glycosyltransferase/peptidoglycan/xylan/chitin deacetylase (PgdA/CDA1 family)/spore germination protein YaaH